MVSRIRKIQDTVSTASKKRNAKKATPSHETKELQKSLLNSKGEMRDVENYLNSYYDIQSKIRLCFVKIKRDKSKCNRSDSLKSAAIFEGQQKNDLVSHGEDNISVTSNNFMNAGNQKNVLYQLNDAKMYDNRNNTMKPICNTNYIESPAPVNHGKLEPQTKKGVAFALRKCVVRLQKHSMACQKEAIPINSTLFKRIAELARNNMAIDRENASEEIYVFTFDLEKALPFPKLSTSVAYYKRNLYVYNFGCHDFNNDVRCMFVWPETEGSRGSQEISSCLTRFIKTHANNHKKIIMYSDACTGQNITIKTALSLLKLVQSDDINAESIEHKFLQSGHSYLPNDSDFAIIESCAKKHQNIFCPDDWYEIIKTSKKKTPFNVIKMSHKDFRSTKPLENSITRTKKN